VNGEYTTQEQCAALLPALINLGKLLKTVRYYPAAHPALKTASHEALLFFNPLLQNGNLTLTVRKEGFFVGPTPIGPDLAVLKNLAFFFFARLVHRILILPDISAQDLCSFARAVTQEPDKIQKGGGLPELLLQAHVTGIWINEIDLVTIQAVREQLAAQGTGEKTGEEETDGYADGGNPVEVHEMIGADTAPGPDDILEDLLAGELDIERLLDQLAKEVSDQRFSLLATKLPPKVGEQLHDKGLPLVLRAISLMESLTLDPSLSTGRRRDALNTLQKLATDNLLDFLTNSLCARDLRQSQRNSITETLRVFKEKAIFCLIGKLAMEEKAQARRFLSDALIQQGPDALPALIEALADSRWYVTRNIIILLGKTQDQRIAGHLRPYLAHKEMRVAREAVRALARIGGSTAVRSLLQVIEMENPELRLQAFLALGAMKDATAVQALINYLQTADPFMKRVELKKAAIKALGAIGSPEAGPGLRLLLKKRRLLWKARFDTLRSCAALALGQIGDEDSVDALKAATGDPSKKVAHAATQALQQIQKG